MIPGAGNPRPKSSRREGPRLGLSSFTLPRHVAAGLLTHRDLVELALLHGCAAVGFGENLPLTALPDAELRDLLTFAEDAGITLEPGARGLDEDELYRLLAIAVRSGSEFVRLLLPRDRFRADLSDIVPRLKPVAERYRDAGLVLALENHESFPSWQMDALCGLVGAGVCLDTANDLAMIESEVMVAETLGPRAVSLHAREFVIRRKPDGLGFDIVGAPLGRGMVAWDHVLPLLPDLMSATLVQWVPDGPEALSQERAWIAPSLDALRHRLASQRKSSA